MKRDFSHCLFLLILLFITVSFVPVSAELRTINQGATIFIGEKNLDISNAIGNPNQNATSVKVGWWANGASPSSGGQPTKLLEIPQSQYSSFFVDPSIFFNSYGTGNWYLLSDSNATGQIAL